MAEETGTEDLPSFITTNGSDLIVNGTVIPDLYADPAITPAPVVT